MTGKMISPKLLLLVFFAGITAGCAHREMNSVIESWQGKKATEVIAAWGQPSEEMRLEGKQLLIWKTHAGRLVNTKQASAPEYDDYCTRLLKADRNGNIMEGSWDGNGCPGWFSGWKR